MKRHTKINPIVICSWLLWAMACGHTSEGPADTSTDSGLPETLTEDSMPQLVANAICNKVVACGCNWLNSGPCYDENACSYDECVANYTQFFAEADYFAQVFQLQYTNAGAQECLDAINAASCSNVDWKSLSQVMWQGTSEVGQSCFGDRSCVSDDAMNVGCVDATCAVVDAAQAVDAGAEVSSLPICN